jgi:hypothetical protein
MLETVRWGTSVIDPRSDGEELGSPSPPRAAAGGGIVVTVRSSVDVGLLLPSSSVVAASAAEEVGAILESVGLTCVGCFLSDAVNSVESPVSFASEALDFIEGALVVSASEDSVSEDFILLFVCETDCVSFALLLTSSLVADLDFVLLECVDAESKSVGAVSEDVACVAFCLIEDDVSDTSVISPVGELLVLVLDCVAVEESIKCQQPLQHVIPKREHLRDDVEPSDTSAMDEVFADLDFELALVVVALPVAF